MSIAGKKRKLKEREEIDTQDEVEDGQGSPTTPESLSVEDAPVKSHAALRKERKKALKGTDNIDTVGEQEKKDKEKNMGARTEAQPTRQNSVWVGNLAYKTTPDALRKFFDGVGDITRIHMPTKTVGSGGRKFNVQADNMGFAYVDFATSDAKTIAITLSESNLDGRKLLIKDGDDFAGRPSAPTAKTESLEKTEVNAENLTSPSQPGHSKFGQKILKKQKQPPAPTLFMGNLPFEIVIDDIRNMLVAHRNVKSKGKLEEEEDEAKEKPKHTQSWLKKIRLGTFEDSGKCKGWAFLDFVDVVEATAALTNPRNHKMNGRELNLEYASPDAVRRGGHLSGKDGERARKKPRVEGSANPPPRKQSNRHEHEHAKSVLEGVDTPTPTEHKPRERLGKDGKARPRPGAALALAKRENVAIVQSEGQKIKF